MSLLNILGDAGTVVGGANDAMALARERAYQQATRDIMLRQGVRADTQQQQDFDTEQQMRAVPPVTVPGSPSQPIYEADQGNDQIGATPAIPEQQRPNYQERARIALQKGSPLVWQRETDVGRHLESQGLVDLSRALIVGQDPRTAVAEHYNTKGTDRIDPASVTFNNGVLTGKRANGMDFRLDPKAALVELGVKQPNLVNVPQGGTLVDPVTRQVVARGATPLTHYRPAEEQIAVDAAKEGAKAKARAQSDAASQLDPDAIEIAADRYRIDGSLPPNLGRGGQGAANTAAILKRSAEKAAASGATGESERLQQLANKASSSAMAQLEKQRNLVLAFKDTAARNADLVLQESEKVDRLGSPVIDRWILAGRKSIAGDPAVARLDAAMRTFVNEYARVTTTVTGGGVTSDAARREIDALLQSAQTKEQVRGVIDLMKLEMGNREAGYSHQMDQLRGSIRSAGSGPENPSQPGTPKTIRFSDLPR